MCKKVLFSMGLFVLFINFNSMNVFAVEENSIGGIHAVERFFDVNLEKCQKAFSGRNESANCRINVTESKDFEQMVSGTHEVEYITDSRMNTCIVSLKAKKNGYQISASRGLRHEYSIMECVERALSKMKLTRVRAVVYTLAPDFFEIIGPE